jgi:hypothetical protein
MNPKTVRLAEGSRSAASSWPRMVVLVPRNRFSASVMLAVRAEL